MNSQLQGQIITFYSYKGGTGRTMALANIACLLAQHQRRIGGKGVLMVDWDLEAPGLHRYFRGKSSGAKNPSTLDDANPGLIDLFYELDGQTDVNGKTPNKLSTLTSSLDESLPFKNERLAQSTIDAINLQKYISPTHVEGLSLIKAGKFSHEDPNAYSERVNKFNWEALYKKSPNLMRLLAQSLSRQYAYVLIDSRTGISDISGICTMLLPEKLVVVFTPNLQSLKGGLDLLQRATDYRKESADLRPLVVFPLVSRVEANEPDLRHDWRFGDDEHKITGYQPEFEALLAEVYEKKEIKLSKYFDEMQIQHIPRYAYGEEIAVLVEKIGDKFSLKRSYETFASKLVESRVPWEGETTRLDFSKDENISQVSKLLDYWRTSNIKESLRLAGVLVLLLLVIFGILLISYSVRKNQQLNSALALEREANNAMRQQLSELQQPLQLLNQKDETIKGLYNQLDQASQDLNAAQQDNLNTKNQMTATQQQLRRCQAELKNYHSGGGNMNSGNSNF